MSEANLVVSILSLAGLCWLALWLYPRYRVDLFRHEMFVLRDGFFSEAARGVISFEHPAYGMLRTTMNGFIRFGHQLPLLQFMAWREIFRAKHPTRTSFQAEWNKNTADLNEEAQNVLRSYRMRMNILIVKHVILGPIPFDLTILAVRRVIAFRSGFKATAAYFKKIVYALDAEALEVGSEA